MKTTISQHELATLAINTVCRNPDFKVRFLDAFDVIVEPQFRSQYEAILESLEPVTSGQERSVMHRNAARLVPLTLSCTKFDEFSVMEQLYEKFTTRILELDEELDEMEKSQAVDKIREEHREMFAESVSGFLIQSKIQTCMLRHSMEDDAGALAIPNHIMQGLVASTKEALLSGDYFEQKLYDKELSFGDGITWCDVDEEGNLIKENYGTENKSNKEGRHTANRQEDGGDYEWASVIGGDEEEKEN